MMLTYLLTFFLSFTAHSQGQPLADYNRTLSDQINSKKPLSAKQFKAMRIRLGTEIASAEDKSYNGQELVKLLKNATGLASLSGKESEQNHLKLAWEKYIDLPNTGNITFEVTEPNELIRNEKFFPLDEISKIDSFLKFAVDQKAKTFFLPLLSQKCDYYEYLRNLEKLKECYNQEIVFKSSTEAANLENIRKLLFYYLHVPALKSEFKNLATKALSTYEDKELISDIKFLSIIIKINSAEVDGIEKEIEALKKQDVNSDRYDSLLLWHLILQNNLKKATAVFKSLAEKGLEPDDLFDQNRLAAMLFFAKKEYVSSENYLQKMSELEVSAFIKMNVSLIRAANAIIAKTFPPPEDIKKTFEGYAKAASESKIDDPEYLAIIRVGSALALHPAINLNELQSSVEQLKKTIYHTNFMTIALDELILGLKKQATVVPDP